MLRVTPPSHHVQCKNTASAAPSLQLAAESLGGTNPRPQNYQVSADLDRMCKSLKCFFHSLRLCRATGRPLTWGQSGTTQRAGRSHGGALLSCNRRHHPEVCGRTHSSTGCTLHLHWSSHLNEQFWRRRVVLDAGDVSGGKAERVEKRKKKKKAPTW